MRIAARREAGIGGEQRVAITPETAAQYKSAGLAVTVEPGAGIAAGHPDAAYKAAGATVGKVDLAKVDVLVHVSPLSAPTARKLRSGAITVGLAAPGSDPDATATLRDRTVTSFALELLPRISRAQSMDALTSQALVAGYRCVLEAAIRFPRFFPLYMTAAGTIPPAKALVLGAGVAGLQAIATAKRLGAKVSAYDVRAASADEVASMGGTFIHLELDAAGDAAGGYAKELAADRSKRQQELLGPHIAQADIIITTAAIPGRPAPKLITASALKGMRAGSIVIDLAAESGGNVAGSKPGEDVQVKVDGGVVTLVGMSDAASRMPADASRLLAKNIANFVSLMTTNGKVAPDFDDEVVSSACMTREGKDAR